MKFVCALAQEVQIARQMRCTNGTMYEWHTCTHARRGPKYLGLQAGYPVQKHKPAAPVLAFAGFHVNAVSTKDVKITTGTI